VLDEDEEVDGDVVDASVEVESEVELVGSEVEPEVVEDVEVEVVDEDVDAADADDVVDVDVDDVEDDEDVEEVEVVVEVVAVRGEHEPQSDGHESQVSPALLSHTSFPHPVGQLPQSREHEAQVSNPLSHTPFPQWSSLPYPGKSEDRSGYDAGQPSGEQVMKFPKE